MTMGGTVIFKGMRTVAALATVVVVASMRCSIHSDCTKSTCTKSLTDAAGAMADFAVFLAAAAEQFGRTSTYQCTLCHMTAVVRMVVIVTGLLSDVDHAIIAAVVMITITAATATSLGNGIIRAQLTSGAMFVVLAESTVAVVVIWVFVGLGAAHNVIVGFTGTDI
jgi:hypothetical protein